MLRQIKAIKCEGEPQLFVDFRCQLNAWNHWEAACYTPPPGRTLPRQTNSGKVSHQLPTLKLSINIWASSNWGHQILSLHTGWTFHANPTEHHQFSHKPYTQWRFFGGHENWTTKGKANFHWTANQTSHKVTGAKSSKVHCRWVGNKLSSTLSSSWQGSWDGLWKDMLWNPPQKVGFCRTYNFFVLHQIWTRSLSKYFGPIV